MIPNRLIAYIIPLFAAFIALEIYLYYRQKKKFPWLEGFVSQAMALSYFAFNMLLSPTLAHFNSFFYELRFFTIPANTVGGALLLFFAVEFIYYWQHRFAHRIRWIWASHSMHHSPVTMTLSGAYRLGITSVFSGVFLFFLPIFLLGFSLQAVAIMFGINLAYQFLLHTDCIPKLGWLEYVFNTPSHHRVHHAINSEYIDKNYGGILIVFDRMFGTFAEEDESRPIEYGLLGKKPSMNPIRLTFQEWQAIARDVIGAKSWKDRFAYAFLYPGWTPRDGGENGREIDFVKVQNREEKPRKASSF